MLSNSIDGVEAGASLIGLLNPLLYLPTVMYFGSPTSALLLSVWNLFEYFSIYIDPCVKLAIL